MNDNSTIVQEVMVRDAITLRMYRVEIESATRYASVIRLKVFDDQGTALPPVVDVHVTNGEILIKAGDSK